MKEDAMPETYRSAKSILSDLNAASGLPTDEITIKKLIREMICLCNDHPDQLPFLEELISRCSKGNTDRDYELRTYAVEFLDFKRNLSASKTNKDKNLPMKMIIDLAYNDPLDNSKTFGRGNILQGTIKANQVVDLVGGAKDNYHIFLSGLKIGVNTVNEAHAGDRVDVYFYNVPESGIQEGQVLADYNTVQTHKSVRIVVLMQNDDKLIHFRKGDELKYHIRLNQQDYPVDVHFISNVHHFKPAVFMDIELPAYTAIDTGMVFCIGDQYTSLSSCSKANNSIGIVIKCLD